MSDIYDALKCNMQWNIHDINFRRSNLLRILLITILAIIRFLHQMK